MTIDWLREWQTGVGHTYVRDKYENSKFSVQTSEVLSFSSRARYRL